MLELRNAGIGQVVTAVLPATTASLGVGSERAIGVFIALPPPDSSIPPSQHPSIPASRYPSIPAFSRAVGRLCITIILLWLATFPAAYALERSDVSFYLSFERGLQPEIATGDTEIKCSAGTVESVAFDPAGRRGRAVKLDDALSITYRNAGMFSRNEGTISFWLKPIGWKAGSGKNHQFLRAHPDNCGFQIYRFYPGNNWAYLFPSNDPKTWRFIGGAKWWDGWEDGKWQHVAFTFKPGEQAIYFGGRLHERKVTDLVEPEFVKSNGITLAAANRGTAQAFDEAIVFKRALSEQEVASLARGPREAPAYLRLPQMRPPVIDGRATTEGEWANGHTLTGWVDPVLGTVNTDDTQVTVAHSRAALHVRFLYAIPGKFRTQRDLYVGAPLKVSVDQADGDIFQDDYVGVYLAPPGATDTYFFGINGAGAKRDEKDGDPAWNGDWEANQARDDEVWIAEFSIPFSALSPKVAPDAVWGINFAHGCRQMDLHDGVWSYAPRMQRPLGTMVLSPQAISVSLAGLRGIAEGKLSLHGRISNRGPAPFAAKGDLSIRTDGRAVFAAPTSPLTVQPNSVESITVEHSLSGPLCGDVALSITDGAGQPLLTCALPFVFSRELAFKIRYYPTTARLEAEIDAGSSAMLANITGARVSIVPEGGTEAVHSTPIDRLDGMQHEVKVDCREFPVGPYDVLAEVRLGDNTATLKQFFIKEPPPEWLGNKLGTFETVPEPWTPLELTGRTVSCWGRDYTFGAASLPAQVRILGQEMLAGPVRLLLTANGQTQSVPLGGFKATETTPLKVTFTTSGRVGAVAVSATAWMEFDGFYRNTIILSAAEPTPVEALAIEVPIKPEFATYWSPSEYFPKKLGKSPREPHASEVRHGMRIGDEERGLQFSYVNAQKQVLVPAEKEYAVRYEFINAPTTIDGPYEITFGLQALPVRPRSPLYRSFKVDDCTFTSDPAKELFNISPLYTEGWSVHWNYHSFWDARAFDPTYIEGLKAAYAKMWEQRKQTYCMYLNIVTSDANTPEYRAYRYEWAGKDAPDPMPYDQATKTKAQSVGINPETPSYEDFYVWHLDKTVRYLTDGGRFPIHCYFDNTASRRGFMKRVYAVMKAVNPLNQIFVHMSGDNNMYAWAFADWLVEGEENTANYQAAMASDPSLPRDYTRIIDVPKVASRYSPFAFGDKFFLYQFWGWNRTEPHEAGPARAHLWGLLFVHDGTTWAAGGPAHKQALIDLGWDDEVEFVPYWRKDTGIAVASAAQPVVASGWTRGDRNLLVMVLNDSDQIASCGLTVDVRRFGFLPGTIECRDYGNGGLAYPESFKQEGPRELPVEWGKPIVFEIGEHSYKLLGFFATPPREEPK